MQNWRRLKTNKQLQKNLFIREQVIDAIRKFFSQNGYREIDVPLLAPALPAEAHLEVFETQLLNRHRQAKRAFLTTSPEMFLKKLLVGGVGNCFSITKSFRNTENMSNLHNPEFTILEWYRIGATYQDLMGEIEELILFVYQKIKSSNKAELNHSVLLATPKSRFPQLNIRSKSTSALNSKSQSSTTHLVFKLIYQNKQIDLTPPWQRLSVIEAFNKFAKMDLEKAMTLSEMKRLAQKKGYKTKNAGWEQLFHQIYLNEIEPQLGNNQPTIIYDFPSSMAMLAKKKKTDPRFSERFEVYIAGLELGDCYSELTDWREQESRFKKAMQVIKKSGKTIYPYDKDFIEALKIGLPQCAGLALGVDRLVMLFANAPNIDDVLYFPASQLWPHGK